MGIISSIKKAFKNDSVNLNDQSVQLDDVLLQALINGETITRDKALTLPAVSSAVDFISGTIASMPVKLYKYKQGKVTEVENDTRVKLLNGDTGDTLDAFQMKKAMTEDYLLGKGGYAVILKDRNTITSLRYVKDTEIGIFQNADPVYKYVQFQVGTRIYKNYEIIKLLRNTKNGAKGKGLIEEVSKSLQTAYSTLLYQLGLVQTGGNKKGFLQCDRKLGQDEINNLKQAWRNLYQNNTENVVVLNNGLSFKESSNSSVEMQLNESKKTLKDEIDSIFHIHDDFNLTFKEAIYPIIKAFETQLNSTMLLETEKRYMFFEFDVKEIVRANLKERYESYGMAIKNGWKTINEVRKEENMNDIDGMDVLNLGLGSVLYDTVTQTYYTPNTDKTSSTNNNSNSQNNEENNQGNKITQTEE